MGLSLCLSIVRGAACPGELTGVTHLMQMCVCVDCGTGSAAAAH